jgi:hypothetical protein
VRTQCGERVRGSVKDALGIHFDGVPDTSDVEDFIADLRKPRIVHRHAQPRSLANASINRTIELLRHMLNWAVGREYIDRTPFRRGTETLIRKLREDNKRQRRISEDEEARLLAVAPPFCGRCSSQRSTPVRARARCWRSASAKSTSHAD